MDWENKTIGFAMCGSFCTMSLIQFNGLPLCRTSWVHNLIFRVQVGASFDSVGENKIVQKKGFGTDLLICTKAISSHRNSILKSNPYILLGVYGYIIDHTEPQALVKFGYGYALLF